ncbi:MAG: response regulator [Burkholderiales bacterium]|nr:response regulator [Burkholderiales bacterium]MDE2433447.1 response regulator [Burkholderiales bacterium]
MKVFRRSLQAYLAFIAAVTTLVLASLSGLLVFHVQTSRSEEESRSLIKSLMATVYNTAAIATFANNQQIGQDAIDGLLKNDVVERAELTGNRGLKIVSERPGSSPNRAAALVEPIRSPFSEDEIVGQLSVEPNREWIAQKARESALTMVAWMAGIIVATAIISMALIRRTLTDPLAAVVKQLNRITPGQATTLTLPRHLQRNEVGVLVDGMNHLLDGVRKALESERSLRTQIEETDAQLRIAMTKTEAAAKAKEDFLASMSHEIRTPLNGVIGTLDLLSLGQLDDNQREQVNAMREASNALLGIINDILDFSKIEAGKLDINPEPVDLSQLLGSVINLYRDTASSKGLTLDLQVSGVDRAVMCDPLRIRQIVSNLISNALKFTKEGGVTIKARGLAKGKDQIQLRIDVIDTGIGIPLASQWKVFSAFSQAEADTAKRFGGTGLGLAICKRLCQLMGGSISLKSTPGKGTTFSVDVPLDITDAQPISTHVEDLAKQVQRAAKPVNLLSVEEAQAQGCLIGIVDDHPINRYVLSRQLTLLGYTCVSTEDGLQALEMTHQYKLALLITDCQMPGMDGYQLSRTIREEEAQTGRQALPILACTAAALQGEAEKCQAAGMSDYMTKPLQMPVLSAMLKKWGPALPTQDDTPDPVETDTQPDNSPIDTAYWERQTGGEDELKTMLAEQFIQTTRGDLDKLHDLARQDHEAAKAQAHRIKGAAVAVGATRLGQLCEELEQRFQEHDEAALKALITQLDQEISRVIAWLDQEVHSAKAL